MAICRSRRCGLMDTTAPVIWGELHNWFLEVICSRWSCHGFFKTITQTKKKQIEASDTEISSLIREISILIREILWKFSEFLLLGNSVFRFKLSVWANISWSSASASASVILHTALKPWDFVIHSSSSSSSSASCFFYSLIRNLIMSDRTERDAEMQRWDCVCVTRNKDSRVLWSVQSFWCNPWSSAPSSSSSSFSICVCECEEKTEKGEETDQTEQNRQRERRCKQWRKADTMAAELSLILSHTHTLSLFLSFSLSLCVFLFSFFLLSSAVSDLLLP